MRKAGQTNYEERSKDTGKPREKLCEGGRERDGAFLLCESSVKGYE